MQKYIYADESGNFDFSRQRGASRYFILATVALEDQSPVNRLYDLRRELAWQGFEITEGFHATDDRQLVRDAVFEIIRTSDLRIDATVLYKPKADPKFWRDELAFYELAWFYHMKHVVPQVTAIDDQLLVIAASIGTKRKRRSFQQAISNVTIRVAPERQLQCVVWSAVSDMCLQVSDYCAWAIQRKWESGDSRSYDLIKSNVNREFDLFAGGNLEYY